MATVSNMRTKITKRFSITADFDDICNKYNGFNPPNAMKTSFLLGYEKDKCTNQKIGINKSGATGKNNLKIFKISISNPKHYTEHSF